LQELWLTFSKESVEVAKKMKLQNKASFLITRSVRAVSSKRAAHVYSCIFQKGAMGLEIEDLHVNAVHADGQAAQLGVLAKSVVLRAAGAPMSSDNDIVMLCAVIRPITVGFAVYQLECAAHRLDGGLSGGSKWKGKKLELGRGAAGKAMQVCSLKKVSYKDAVVLAECRLLSLAADDVAAKNKWFARPANRKEHVFCLEMPGAKVVKGKKELVTEVFAVPSAHELAAWKTLLKLRCIQTQAPLQV
jgi:hypothetical protein